VNEPTVAEGKFGGIPQAAGKVEAAVTATIDRQVRKLDEKALVWGRENVLSTATQRVGTATQTFVIDVQWSGEHRSGLRVREALR